MLFIFGRDKDLRCFTDFIVLNAMSIDEHSTRNIFGLQSYNKTGHYSKCKRRDEKLVNHYDLRFPKYTTKISC